jgi:hypothetical protein
VCLSTCVHIPIVSLLCPFPTDLSVIKVDRFKINFNQVELSVRKFWGRSAWTEQLKQDNCWKWLKMAENAENGWKCLKVAYYFKKIIKLTYLPAFSAFVRNF